MVLPLYQVDAFASAPFTGNPAAVCPLDDWLDDARMQAIAMEMQLSETAFFVPQDDGFALRWFTPAVEVDLCGHATLAAAHVLYEHLSHPAETPIRFHTRSGMLEVSRESGGTLAMRFPAVAMQPDDSARDAMQRALGVPVREVLAGMDWMAVLDDAESVHTLRPQAAAIAALGRRGLIVTAAADDGTGHDYVCRFFAPNAGIEEDPVTGSAHCALAPYWARRLGRARLHGWQCSARSGLVDCHCDGDAVVLRGTAVTVLEGRLYA